MLESVIMCCWLFKSCKRKLMHRSLPTPLGKLSYGICWKHLGKHGQCVLALNIWIILILVFFSRVLRYDGACICCLKHVISRVVSTYIQFFTLPVPCPLPLASTVQCLIREDLNKTLMLYVGCFFFFKHRI